MSGRIIITPEAFSSLYIRVLYICDMRHSIERVVEFRSFVEHSKFSKILTSEPEKKMSRCLLTFVSC